MKYQSDYNFLQHYGIKGQQWGVRQFQNADGSYTEAGRKRYSARNRRKDLAKPFRIAEHSISKKLSNNPTPFEKKDIDLAEVQKRGRINRKDAELCANLATDIFEKASELEPQITSDVISAAKRAGTRMYGLEYRLKQPTSLASKIGSDAVEKDVSYEEAASGIKDAIHYTSVSKDADFLKSYRKMKGSLESLGYSEERCKNYFALFHEGKVQHKAVQCVFLDSDGNRFELQFQTPSSQAAKELKLPLYFERRQLNISEERKAYLEKEMRDLADYVPYPPGYMEIESHG
jgi:hypothetical protein